MQVAPHGEQKLVRCTRGKIYDVVVDCRRGSSSLLNWFGIELAEGDGKMLLIPEGFAHGYQALEDGAEITYRSSSPYCPTSEVQINNADPEIAIEWPITEKILSPKDSSSDNLPTGFQGWIA